MRLVLAGTVVLWMSTAGAFSQSNFGPGYHREFDNEGNRAHPSPPALKPMIATVVPDLKYPLRFAVVTSTQDRRWFDERQNAIHLVGVARLGTDTGAEFAYTSYCYGALLASGPKDDVFQARWKSYGESLEILTEKPGEAKIHTCELKIARNVSVASLLALTPAPGLSQ